MPIFGALLGLFVVGSAGTTVVPAIAAAPGSPVYAYAVTLTAYNAVPGQTDDDPFITASGSFANPEVVAARSRDFADKLPFGTVIEIDGTNAEGKYCNFDAVSSLIGYRVIADTMNARHENHIDVLLPVSAKVPFQEKSVSAARVLGGCKNVVVKVVGFVDISRPSKLPKTQEDLAMLVTEGAALALAAHESFSN